MGMTCWRGAFFLLSAALKGNQKDHHHFGKIQKKHKDVPLSHGKKIALGDPPPKPPPPAPTPAGSLQHPPPRQPREVAAAGDGLVVVHRIVLGAVDMGGLLLLTPFVVCLNKQKNVGLVENPTGPPSFCLSNILSFWG